MKHKIILASKSKRRAKILRECRIPHSIVVSNIQEKMDHKKGPRFNVLHNAETKAKKVAQKHKNCFIIGADTVVVLGKRLIGKPKTKKEAKLFLKAFSGKTILVYTGLCLIDSKTGRSVSGVDLSKIQVKNLSDKKIDEFISISGPHDKAGGFSIEGPGVFIFDNIQGSFYNILGLPMIKLYELFEELGVDLCSKLKP